MIEYKVEAIRTSCKLLANMGEYIIFFFKKNDKLMSLQIDSEELFVR